MYLRSLPEMQFVSGSISAQNKYSIAKAIHKDVVVTGLSGYVCEFGLVVVVRLIKSTELLTLFCGNSSVSNVREMKRVNCEQ